MLARSKNMGNKKIIFMIRHENDLDFMLPIILYAVNNPVVFIWGAIKPSDFRIAMLKNEGIEHTFLDGVHKSMRDRIFLKILRVFQLSLYEKYLNVVREKMQSFMLDSLECYLRKINSKEVDYVVFDHTINKTVELMFLTFKQWSSNNVKFFSLPHSKLVIGNKMLKYELITPNDGFVDWNAFDKMVFFNHHHVSFMSDIEQSKIIILPSLRNTVEWINLLRENNPDSNQIVRENNRIRFLIIHSQLSSNINREEVVRMIKILDHFDCFDVRIKPHPRREADVLELLKMSKNVSLIHDHITECIHWSEYVLFFHSSAINDVILLKKPILYPNFASSNILVDDILSQCNVLNTPDEFYDFIGSIVRNNKKGIIYPDFEVLEWNALVDKWGELLT